MSGSVTISGRRRDGSLARCLVLSALAVLLSGGVPVVGQQGAPPPRRVIIVGDELKPMAALADSLRRRRFLVELADQQAFIRQDFSNLHGILVYIHKPLKDAVENRLIDYTRRGGRTVVLHHGLASAKLANPKWMQFMGVRILPRNHPQYPWHVMADTDHDVINLQPGHYVTSHGVKYTASSRLDLTSTDNAAAIRVDIPAKLLRARSGPIVDCPSFRLEHTEIFVNQRLDPDFARTVLTGVLVRDPVSGSTALQASGWFARKGNGLLFYFQAGHQAEDFQNANYLQLLVNSLTWDP